MALAVGCGEKAETSPPQTAGIKKTNSTAFQIKQSTNILPGMQASPLESTNVARAYKAIGVIKEFPAGGKSVIVRHEEIPGFMPKRTMDFDVRDTNELRGLAVGDTIAFNVRANAEESWIEDIHRATTNDVLAPGPTDPSSATILNAAKLKEGDNFPDAELIAEDGRTVHMSDFAGKAIAFTFIFTRCPLPDYCPRMNQHFRRVREKLLTDQPALTNWQFISVSFDPEFDKPGVLTRYAFSYRGNNADRWLFAAAPKQVLNTLSSDLDFRFMDEKGTFMHNLRTVVLDTKRRVHRQLNGNKWTSDELAEAMVEAAKVAP